MAGLFAFLDTNNNLDTLNKEDWSDKMWMNMFANQDLTPLRPE